MIMAVLAGALSLGACAQHKEAAAPAPTTSYHKYPPAVARASSPWRRQSVWTIGRTPLPRLFTKRPGRFGGLALFTLALGRELQMDLNFCPRSVGERPLRRG